jgi:hypothetical protein
MDKRLLIKCIEMLSKHEGKYPMDYCKSMLYKSLEYTGDESIEDYVYETCNPFGDDNKFRESLEGAEVWDLQNEIVEFHKRNVQV